MATSQKTSRSRATKPYTPQVRADAARARTAGAPPEPETGLRGWRSFGPADARLRTPARPQPARLPDPGGQLPPLPSPIPMFDDAEARAWMNEGDRPEVALDDTGRPVVRHVSPAVRIRSLRHGCYYLRYIPTGLSFFRQYEYRGTLRVERQGSVFGGNTVASADLYYYRRPLIQPPIVIEPRVPIPIPDPGPLVPPTGPRPGPIGARPVDGFADAQAADGPNPADGIPIFSRNKYTYYLSITQILEGFSLGNGFTLGFTRHAFNRSANSFTPDGNFTAAMTWKAAPPGYPSQYLEGEVRSAGGAVVGTITMGWVSSYLRRATVEIDRVAASEPPLDSGAGHTWRSVFDAIGWDVTIAQSNADVTEPSGEGWSDAEMHAAMLARRDSSNLDTDWRYHILCVRRIDSTPRGIMYDAGATDSNNVPREGIGISTHWMIPNTPVWGRVRGQRFGAAAAPYFRTALHEIGHAMGLYHNTADFGIMNTTDVISAGAVLPLQFPDNVKWAHADDDRKRLKHLPDIWVRPGGIPFGPSYGTAPISPDDRYDAVPGVDFTATPLLTTVPIGAPVRVNLMLTNRTARPLLLPADLGLRGGFVRGKVVDPAGTVRTFSPLILCVDEERMTAVDPEQSVTESLTLLRGGEGALFPMAGTYRISIELDWDAGATTVGTTAEAVVMVTPAVDEEHAEAALDVLCEPDTLPAMVIGGDHLVDGVAAIQSAVNNPVLAPHFAIIEAKRVAKSAGKRKPVPEDVAALLDGGVVATEPEIRRLAQLVADTRATDGARKKVAAALKARADDVGAGPETRKALDALEP